MKEIERSEDPLIACEREAIRIPGAIQSHGLLIALRHSDLTILQISENAYSILGIPAEELLHQPLSKLMPIDRVEHAKEGMRERQPRILNPLPIDIEAHGRSLQFDGILHRSGRLLILELETHVHQKESVQDGMQNLVRSITTSVVDSVDLGRTLSFACHELRRFTGYSRVLAYRFDENWDGQVVAESLGPDAESLMDHRFPGADIPRQARELYTTNWVRIIPDINYRPAALVPRINPITDEPTDLTNSVLRAVSPIHLEYMRNMGYEASMSVSLLDKGRLWGLIACHNRLPRPLTYDTRVAAEFIGQILSSQISSHRDDSADEPERLFLRFVEELVRGGGNLPAVLPTMYQCSSTLLRMLNARGLAVVGAEVDSIGTLPGAESLRALVIALDEKNEEVFVSRSIAKDFPDLPRSSDLAGVLSFRATGARWVFLRPERVDTISWSGNPHLAKEIDEDGRIRPRKSFATWIETIRETSDAWTSGEIKVGHRLKRVLESLTSPESSQVSRPVIHQAAGSAVDSAFAAFPGIAALNLDLEGRVTHWSEGAETMLGFSPAQASGSRLDILFSDEDRLQNTLERLLRRASRARSYTHEGWLYRANHTSFWAKLRFASAYASDLGSYSVLIEDISKDKMAEEELKSTKIAAEAANVAKTSFLANISHEIRTPLGAVLGFAELLADPRTPESHRQRLFERIRTNGDQLLALINDLLDMTKVEANKLAVENLEFDLAHFLVDLADTFELKASETGIDFAMTVEGSLPQVVLSDPTRLRQILVNLLSNAFKFTPAGGMVRCSCRFERHGSKGQLQFRVSDTGRGMSETEMSRLFQPFTQADLSTTRKYGGTGLGLYISQRIARLLNGDLSIERSVEKRGSTFLASIEPERFSLNRTFDVLATTSKKLNAEPKTARVLEGRKILVVDDSPDNQELIATFLEDVGARVVVADNGRAALEACAKETFDVILMDIQMPVMDGPTAVQELHAKGIRTPIVALTAHAMGEERRQSAKSGFADYLTKPVDWRRMVAVLDRIVRA